MVEDPVIRTSSNPEQTMKWTQKGSTALYKEQLLNVWSVSVLSSAACKSNTACFTVTTKKDKLRVEHFHPALVISSWGRWPFLLSEETNLCYGSRLAARSILGGSGRGYSYRITSPLPLQRNLSTYEIRRQVWWLAGLKGLMLPCVVWDQAFSCLILTFCHCFPFEVEFLTISHFLHIETLIFYYALITGGA